MNLTKILFLLTFIFSASYTHSQTSIGLKGGIQLATWDADLEDSFGLEDPKTKIGIQFGAIYEISLSDLISIQPEFLYIQKGARFEPEDYYGYGYYYGAGEIEVENKFFFNYLELPVLLKFKFGDNNNTNFFLTAGPSFGYLSNGKIEFELTTDGRTQTQSEDIEFEDDDDISRFDLSASFGAGVGLPLGIGRLTFETRYLLGLSNLNSNNDFDDNIKNRGLAISLGYMIPLSSLSKKGDKK